MGLLLIKNAVGIYNDRVKFSGLLCGSRRSFIYAIGQSQRHERRPEGRQIGKDIVRDRRAELLKRKLRIAVQRVQNRRRGKILRLLQTVLEALQPFRTKINNPASLGCKCGGKSHGNRRFAHSAHGGENQQNLRSAPFFLRLFQNAAAVGAKLRKYFLNACIFKQPADSAAVFLRFLFRQDEHASKPMAQQAAVKQLLRHDQNIRSLRHRKKLAEIRRIRNDLQINLVKELFGKFKLQRHDII